MALRLVEIFLPAQAEAKLFDMLEGFSSAVVVQKEYADNQLHTQLLMKAERTELLLDKLEAGFLNKDEFRIIIQSVEATIPRMPQTLPDDVDQPQAVKHKIKHARVSREEP